MLCCGGHAGHAEAGAELPQDRGNPLNSPIPDLLEGQFCKADPQMVVQLIAAGAAWLPVNPWLSMDLVCTLSMFKWQTDDMVSVLVCMYAGRKQVLLC
jgi:hypothetical protein